MSRKRKGNGPGRSLGDKRREKRGREKPDTAGPGGTTTGPNAESGTREVPAMQPAPLPGPAPFRTLGLTAAPWPRVGEAPGETGSLLYRCDGCGRTTIVMRVRRPITIRGAMVGEPGSLKHCMGCEEGMPMLVRQDMEKATGT